MAVFALMGVKALYLFIVWLVWPAKAASRWKIQGPIPRRGRSEATVAEVRAAEADAEKS